MNTTTSTTTIATKPSSGMKVKTAVKAGLFTPIANCFIPGQCPPKRYCYTNC